MHQVHLEAKKRSGRGKGAARALRREGWLPGNLYGGGGPNVPLQLDRRRFWTALTREDIEHALVNLNVEGEEQTLAVVKEIQRGPVRYELLHVDFQRVRADEEITMEVAVHLVGEPIGVQRGGILEHLLRNLEIRTIVSNIPEAIEVDVSGLDIGDSLHVGEIPVPEGTTILNDPEAVVAAVAAPRVVEEPTAEGEEEEEEREPERVGERQKEEEG
ncbi:MAG: hypothetical protein KatS3mg115_1869 [Candidatus Poribacteria bacterium]|nr:MAG: hypothetical protein KatS3mg115_1869 [Candidatus Poribacteria bacterium]